MWGVKIFYTMQKRKNSKNFLSIFNKIVKIFYQIAYDKKTLSQ